MEQAVETYGRLDILVHGAGIGVHQEIVDMSDADWDLQIDVQLRGAFLLSRAVGKQLIKQGKWRTRLTPTVMLCWLTQVSDRYMATQVVIGVDG